VSRSSAVAARALPLILGGAIAGVAFGAQGGTELTRTTVTEVAMVAVSAAVMVAAFLWSRAGTIQGVTTVLMFALLALLTAVSVVDLARADLYRDGAHDRLSGRIRGSGGGRAARPSRRP
jgi:hypothetical protein